MNIKNSLIQALDRFDVKSKTLADTSGLSQSQLSHFRSGRRGLEVENLEKLINVLEPEVRAYFCSLLAGSEVTLDTNSAEQFIMNISPDELGRVLSANSNLLMEAIAYLDRDFRAAIVGRIMELYRSEPVSKQSREPAVCR